MNRRPLINCCTKWYATFFDSWTRWTWCGLCSTANGFFAKLNSRVHSTLNAGRSSRPLISILLCVFWVERNFRSLYICERLMEPIVTRSIRILTVGLATEYESYYTARHTRCCCVFCLLFPLFFACSRVLYDIFNVVCAERTAGVCLRQYMCACFSFIRSLLQNAKRSSHTLTWCGVSGTETEWREKMKEKNA